MNEHIRWEVGNDCNILYKTSMGVAADLGWCSWSEVQWEFLVGDSYPKTLRGRWVGANHCKSHPDVGGDEARIYCLSFHYLMIIYQVQETIHVVFL